MIYEVPEAELPLRQGDIFLNLPSATFSLQKLPIVKDGRFLESNWQEVLDSSGPGEALVTLGAAPAIIISQDCDSARAPEISLCEIRPFAEVCAKAKTTVKDRSWVSVLTVEARNNPKWFYLPPKDGLFENRM